MAKKFFTLQTKGGVGKSYFTELMYILANNLDLKKDVYLSTTDNKKMEVRKENKTFLFLDCDNANRSFLRYVDASPKKAKHITTGSFSLMKKGSSEIDKDLFFQFTKTCLDLQEKHKYDYMFIDFGADTSGAFVNFLKIIGDDATKKFFEYGFIPVVIFASTFASSPGLACNEYYESLPKIVKDCAVKLYNPRFDMGNHNITKQNETIKGEYISIPKHNLPEDEYALLFNSLLKDFNFNNILENYKKKKGEFFLLSEGHGKLITNYLNELKQFALSFL